MSREFRIPHDPTDTPQTYTAKVEAFFRAHGLDLHRHEVTELVDDWKKKQRVLVVKNTKYVIL